MICFCMLFNLIFTNINANSEKENYLPMLITVKDIFESTDNTGLINNNTDIVYLKNKLDNIKFIDNLSIDNISIDENNGMPIDTNKNNNAENTSKFYNICPICFCSLVGTSHTDESNFISLEEIVIDKPLFCCGYSRKNIFHVSCYLEYYAKFTDEFMCPICRKEAVGPLKEYFHTICTVENLKLLTVFLKQISETRLNDILDTTKFSQECLLILNQALQKAMNSNLKRIEEKIKRSIKVDLGCIGELYQEALSCSPLSEDFYRDFTDNLTREFLKNLTKSQLFNLIKCLIYRSEKGFDIAVYIKKFLDAFMIDTDLVFTQREIYQYLRHFIDKKIIQCTESFLNHEKKIKIKFSDLFDIINLVNDKYTDSFGMYFISQHVEISDKSDLKARDYLSLICCFAAVNSRDIDKIRYCYIRQSIIYGLRFVDFDLFSFSELEKMIKFFCKNSYKVKLDLFSFFPRRLYFLNKKEFNKIKKMIHKYYKIPLWISLIEHSPKASFSKEELIRAYDTVLVKGDFCEISQMIRALFKNTQIGNEEYIMCLIKLFEQGHISIINYFMSNISKEIFLCYKKSKSLINIFNLFMAYNCPENISFLLPYIDNDTIFAELNDECLLKIVGGAISNIGGANNIVLSTIMTKCGIFYKKYFSYFIEYLITNKSNFNMIQHLVEAYVTLDIYDLEIPTIQRLFKIFISDVDYCKLLNTWFIKNNRSKNEKLMITEILKFIVEQNNLAVDMPETYFNCSENKFEYMITSVNLKSFEKIIKTEEYNSFLDFINYEDLFNKFQAAYEQYFLA